MERGDGQRGAKRRLSLSCRLLPPLSLALVLLLVAAWAPVGGPPLHDAPDLSAYPWLYLRGGQPLAAGEQVVEVVAVGDVMLGRGVVKEAQPFAMVAPWLRAADLAVGNLECAIAAGGTPRPGPYRLRAPLSAAAALGDAGFDVVAVANNHSLDYGSQGLAGTVARLQDAGIDTVGAGLDIQAAFRPVIREVGGVRLAFLAFNSVPDPDDGPQDGGWTRANWDRERVLAAIAAARSQASAVIVSVHWGYEYELGADPAQRDAAQAMLDAGADLVIGHHPHVVQGTQAETSEVSRGQFVAYSLGNFVFDQEQGEMQQGLALRAFFDGQGLRAVQALPLRAGPRPRLLAPGDAAPLLARVQPPGAAHPEPGEGSRRTGFACAGGSCRPASVPQEAAEGPFRAGAIDLTGDGLPEQVRREGEQVAVYDGGSEVWRGLPEWRVVDVALGDANDDGRSELLLALWKLDGDGVPRSHPFVAGFREGAYRILWGGSAAADPIREVELGDVDGDGRQELVALEERGDGCTVTVWRWHGWGFSLLWRSPAGRYRDLVLVPGEAGQPPLISVATDP
jgi:poly-gamma-glutamate capsule biosynthesis protein CapA/YwtB (metallophosphatase superfamily)